MLSEGDKKTIYTANPVVFGEGILRYFKRPFQTVISRCVIGKVSGHAVAAGVFPGHKRRQESFLKNSIIHYLPRLHASQKQRILEDHLLHLVFNGDKEIGKILNRYTKILHLCQKSQLPKLAHRCDCVWIYSRKIWI